MNQTSVEAVVSHAGRRIELPLILDNGMMCTCLPTAVWRELGLVDKRRLALTLGDGTQRHVGVSQARLELPGYGEAITPVVLGEPRDAAVLGMLTLAELGYTFDPLSRAIVPAVMHLRSARLAS